MILEVETARCYADVNLFKALFLMVKSNTSIKSYILP
jgi:hypothetical protein